MKEKQVIVYEICTLDQMFRKMAEATVEKSGVSQMQSWFIRYLYEHTIEQKEEVFQKDLEAFFHVPRSTATGLLKSMEKQKMILRESVKCDARLKRLILTQKGIDIQLTIMELFDQNEFLLKENIPEEQMDTFFEVIHMLKGNIRKHFLEQTHKKEVFYAENTGSTNQRI